MDSRGRLRDGVLRAEGDHLRDKFAAKVTSIDDPEQRGRLKVECRALVEDGVELPDWVEPAFPYVGSGDAGFFFLPDVGEFVELEVLTGDADEDFSGVAFQANPDLRWISCLYTDGDAVPAEFREKYGKRMGIKTPSGSFLMFDEDTKDLVLKAGGKVLVGSPDSDEPLVLGNKFKDFAGRLIDAILAITVTTSTGPSTLPLLNAATFAALKAELATLLSDIAFTEKGTPPT